MWAHKKDITFALLAFGVLFWIFAGSEIYNRVAVDLDGTIVSSETTCMQPYNNRCVTVYVIEGANHLLTTYAAGPTDSDLVRRLPFGTKIVKHKWLLGYTVDKTQVNDFPVVFYFGMLALWLVVGLCCTYWLYSTSGGTRQKIGQ